MLSQLFLLIVTFPLFCLGALIPNSRKIWVFGHALGYKDNPRYLYEYQVKDPSIRAVWISRERRPVGIQGEWAYYLSIRGVWLQYRAGVACMGTGGGDLARFTAANTFIVQLWHGIPIKKLLLDSPETFPFPPKALWLNRLFSWWLRRHLRKYDLLIAVNEHNRECLSKAFGMDKGRIAVTGMPRHDIILEASGDLKRSSVKILYAPTWYPSIKEAEGCVRTVLSPVCIDFYMENKIEMDVSIHPLNRELHSIVAAVEGVALYLGDDINRALPNYDLLITDYSSIALDFSLLNRPVVFMCPSLAKYANERGVYDYFLKILRHDHAEDETGLIERLSSVLSANRSCRRRLYDIVADGNARKRIVDIIKRKI